MENLYKSFNELYKIENYFEYKSFFNYIEINNIKEQWDKIIEEYYKKYKINFYDFYDLSKSILELIR